MPSTGVDSTAYYARVMRKDLPLALDILSDIILAPRFDRTELARERDVILQEIAACARFAGGHRVRSRRRRRPSPISPLGRPILGTVRSVSGFKREPSRHLSLGALSRPQHGARRRGRRRS